MSLLATVIALSLVTIVEGSPPTSPVPEGRCAVSSGPACPGACDDGDFGDIERESRVAPDPRDDESKVLGRLIFGLMRHGSQFRVSGEWTEKEPFRLEIPLGRLFALILEYPTQRFVYDRPLLWAY